MPIVVGGIVNPAPFAPLLVAPANASYAPLATGAEFEWTYQPATVGATQTAWALRRKVSGAASYQWWNAGTSAWQSSSVFNTGSTQSVTFASGKWTDGFTYNWSVATQDANGTGSYSPTDTVVAQAGPTVSVLAPAGTCTTAQPTVQWAPAPGAGASVTSYRMVLYDSTQYLATGFTPGSGPSIYDTGQVGSAYTSKAVIPSPIFLTSGTQYRAYVKITETGGQASPWAYSAFTATFVTPATPTITVSTGVDGTTGAPVNIITVTGHTLPVTTGGFLGHASATIEYSNNGVTWFLLRGGTSVPIPAVGQEVTVVDHEAPPGFVRHYRARVLA